jgi:hypothetical protein
MGQGPEPPRDPLLVRGDLRHGLKRLAAEFAVIVMGVLVALGVDEWREARGERDLARQYMTGLIADIEADSASLALVDRAIRRQRNSVADIRDGSATNVREALQSHRNIAYMIELPPAGATYEDLLTTGNLRLIREGETRRAVVSYHRYRENARLNLRDAREGLGLLAPPSDYAAFLPPQVFAQDDLAQLSDSVWATVDTLELRASNPVVRHYVSLVTTYHGISEQVIGNLRPRTASLLILLRDAQHE